MICALPSKYYDGVEELGVHAMWISGYLRDALLFTCINLWIDKLYSALIISLFLPVFPLIVYFFNFLKSVLYRF